MEWKWGNNALSQKKLSEVVFASGRIGMFNLYRTFPDEQQFEITHRLNSFSVATNIAGYQSHLFSQNPFGYNLVPSLDFSGVLALRLGLPFGPEEFPVPCCQCLKSK